MNHQLDQTRVQRRLIRTLATYDEHAVVQKELCARALERFDYIKHEPQHILDLSLHSRDGEAILHQRFPKARYMAASPLLAELQQRKRRWFKKPLSVCVPFGTLPFQTACVDFIFMNLTLLWTNDWPLLLRECRRLLKPKGMLLFTTLGPDTLIELQEAATHPCVHSFVDMHDIGDAMIHAGFENPVTDMEKVVLQYASLRQLVMDLKRTGCNNARNDRANALMTPRQWQHLEKRYPSQQGVLPATFEFVYGHAWAGEHLPQRTNEAGDVAVSLSSLR